MPSRTEFDGVIAIDGPSGSGKSSVSRRLATELGAACLDTGAMYRAATLAVLRSAVSLTDTATIIKVVEDTGFEFGTTPEDRYTRIEGENVDDAIRGPEVTAHVSAVSGIPEVRRHLIAAQRAIIADAAHGIVVEGRDIGEVVAPDADLKIYLTADPAERAKRRSGQNGADLAATAADIHRRDTADAKTTRPHDAAPGAVVVDTTHLDLDQVVTALHELLAHKTTGTA
ncbi:cytidylate kinase [Stackebrandtia albiflava]|uniref:Cytidylate kinase n=1 Tax=Stackebrandtia albiflava TaxID=406432 RepID=A0A562VES1_9ACTN|nr:(d)CMP kinase [Stackebrandtia albiflava]TWJ16386.1 cytidylate kinase [Stackebrandtia albiflava]